LPKIAGAAGIDYPSLCEAILRGARLHAGLFTHDDRRVASTRRGRQQSHIVCTGDEQAPGGETPASDYSAPSLGTTRRRARRAAG
jgi:hypothetical protein